MAKTTFIATGDVFITRRLGAVGYDGTQTNVVLPENIQKALEEIEQQVIDGTLVPPETMDEIEAWAAANQYSK